MEDMTVQDEHIKLMLKFQAGDENAFDGLVAAYKRSTMAVAYRFLQNQHDAEDACQDTFVKVYKSRHQYKQGYRFSSWIFTILNRVCLNMLRYRKRHPAVSLDQPLNNDGDNMYHHLKDENAVIAGDKMAADEARNMVRRAVMELGPQERMAMILDHWENKSMAEIAGILNKSVPAVKSMLFRARAKCRIKLQAYLELAKTG